MFKKMDPYSTLTLPSTFSRSATSLALGVARHESSTLVEQPVPLRVVDIQRDLSCASETVLTFNKTFDQAYPLAHRQDLPAHEQGLSAESLTMLLEGVEAVRAGQVRAVDLSELADDE